MNPNKLRMYQERIAAAIQKHGQIPQPCLLCQRPTHHRGAYVPFELGKFSPPKGKMRIALYPLCERHIPLSRENSEKIEDLLDKAITPTTTPVFNLDLDQN